MNGLSLFNYHLITPDLALRSSNRINKGVMGLRKEGRKRAVGGDLIGILI